MDILEAFQHNACFVCVRGSELGGTSLGRRKGDFGYSHGTTLVPVELCTRIYTTAKWRAIDHGGKLGRRS